MVIGEGYNLEEYGKFIIMKFVYGDKSYLFFCLQYIYTNWCAYFTSIYVHSIGACFIHN